MTETEVREAVAAFRHLGLTDAARLVEDALALPDEGAREALTDQYYELSQRPLHTAFERHYADHPTKTPPSRDGRVMTATAQSGSCLGCATVLSLEEVCAGANMR